MVVRPDRAGRDRHLAGCYRYHHRRPFRDQPSAHAQRAGFLHGAVQRARWGDQCLAGIAARTGRHCPAVTQPHRPGRDPDDRNRVPSCCARCRTCRVPPPSRTCCCTPSGRLGASPGGWLSDPRVTIDRRVAAGGTGLPGGVAGVHARRRGGDRLLATPLTGRRRLRVRRAAERLIANGATGHAPNLATTA